MTQLLEYHDDYHSYKYQHSVFSRYPSSPPGVSQVYQALSTLEGIEAFTDAVKAGKSDIAKVQTNVVDARNRKR